MPQQGVSAWIVRGFPIGTTREMNIKSGKELNQGKHHIKHYRK